MNWSQWINWAKLILKNSASARRDAELILSKTINKSRIQLLTFGETLLDHNVIIKLESLILRRLMGEPVAYLIREKEFWSLNFKISPGVFIPRPDTECLIEQVLRLIPITTRLNVLDLGTGIGTIALTLASERPYWNIIGLDLQKKSLNLARKNQYLFNLKNTKFIYGNWFKYLKEKNFNLIVSNPPYICMNDTQSFTHDLMFEPQQALISNNSGLADLTTICRHSAQYLSPKGWLVLEHGWNQGKYLRKLFCKFGFTQIHTARDYHDYERVTYGQKLY